jgi:hypothetical protein
MSWWKRLSDRVFGQGQGTPEAPTSKPAKWLGADDPGNPFGVPILDLMSNLELISATKDASLASRAVSWRPGQHERLNFTLDGERINCNLNYRAALALPDGMLFVPSAMEEKWVIAWRNGQIAAARSWSGETEAVAEAELQSGWLRVTKLTIATKSSLRSFGDPVSTFDWLLKSHALGERIPLPVSEEGAALLQAVPVASFAPFGHRTFCAAVDYSPPDSTRMLRSDGALIAAVQDADAALIKQLIAEGHDIHAPSTCAGYTALHLAVVKGRPELVQLLLDLGADPHRTADRMRTPLPLALVHNEEPKVMELLLDAGADLEASDDKGFSALHAAAEVGNVTGIRHLLRRGASIQARTQSGLSALHIACALGHIDAARELVRQGADVAAKSELGTVLDVARREKKDNVVAWLESL